jgi:hypothetical protein
LVAAQGIVLIAGAARQANRIAMPRPVRDT